MAETNNKNSNSCIKFKSVKSDITMTLKELIMRDFIVPQTKESLNLDTPSFINHVKDNHNSIYSNCIEECGNNDICTSLEQDIQELAQTDFI